MASCLCDCRGMGFDRANEKVQTEAMFSVLNAIANREEMRHAELAKLLEIDESTLSRNVARMCARGWLRLQPGEGTGAAIESRSRKKEWLCCDKATPPGKRPKTWSPTGWGRTESQL